MHSTSDGLHRTITLHWKTSQNTKNPDIKTIMVSCEKNYANRKHEQLPRVTGKKLTARYRNNEYQIHQQSFSYRKNQRNTIDYIPRYLKMRVEQTNHPFPQDKYNALLKASGNAINDCVNHKTKWDWIRHKNGDSSHPRYRMQGNRSKEPPLKGYHIQLGQEPFRTLLSREKQRENNCGVK